MIARCWWRPGQDSWAVAEEFCRLHYGRAAGPIIEYLTMMHDNAEALGCHPGCFPAAAEVWLSPEVAQKAIGYFERARAAADEAVRARVEKASICAHKAVIETGGRMEYVDGACRMALADKDHEIVDRYIALCKRHKMTMAAEQEKAAEYFEKIKRAAKGIPAVRLENGVWRVTLVPEDNARIVEMFHKPTGRHLMGAMGRYNYGMRFWRGTTFVELGMQGYHHYKAGFGVLASYYADEMAYPRLWWNPDWPTANLELVTRAAVLKKGESFSYRYSFGYLSKPPT